MGYLFGVLFRRCDLTYDEWAAERAAERAKAEHFEQEEFELSRHRDALDADKAELAEIRLSITRWHRVELEKQYLLAERQRVQQL